MRWHPGHDPGERIHFSGQRGSGGLSLLKSPQSVLLPHGRLQNAVADLTGRLTGRRVLEYQNFVVVERFGFQGEGS